ncbi:MAG: helix-turn-helix transcriptional regulator [Chitinophagaceae bacterium]|nr:helix-turn-helix transcriptional regulator [Chitinophagaceae bacterium]
MDISVKDFFQSIRLDSPPSPEDYKKAQSYIRFAEALSKISYQSIYLIDYYKKGFLYVSDNPLFLCGKTALQVLQLGYSFYLEHVPQEDLELLLKINEAGFEFYKKMPLEKRLDGSISYDFRLRQPKGHLKLINHKLTPLALDNNGNMWLALCIVSPSPNNKPGNIAIKTAADKKIYNYNLSTGKWEENTIVSLNSREKEILMLSIQGLTVEKIAKELYLSVNTIKFHKTALFKKLNADNISEAIFAALNFGAI